MVSQVEVAEEAGELVPRRDGDVHRFRLALFREHLATSEGEFKNPECVGCVRRVREIASTLWDRCACAACTCACAPLPLSPPLAVTQLIV